MSLDTTKEKHGFQTEVKQILNLVINSLYSNKEIFLRELISNASDAIDKFRFESVTNTAISKGHGEFKITVDIDQDAKTMTISDNGIGMSKSDVFDNLGTIAKSGTKDFLSKISNNKDASNNMNLIGQFGVGFYSSFMVAKKVVVNTRKAGLSVNEAVRWESDGSGEFEVSNISKSTYGTDITLYFKTDIEDFLNKYKLKTIINKYSDHISWPIFMLEDPKVENTENVDGAAKEKDAKKKEDNTKLEKVIPKYEQINRATALWVMSKQDIKDDEYKELYKHISNDYQDPMTWSHNHVEGKQEYISLLYIPNKAPFNITNRDYKHGLKLYVNRVFIMDEADQFLPQYLRFVKGIIDSSDLPLNVSREILQSNQLVESIKNATSKRALTMLSKLSKDKEKYATFWNEFGSILKEGIVEDYTNKEKIAELILFSTNTSESQSHSVSLDEYIERMDKDQKNIYYITSESYLAGKNSPHLEYFQKNNIEVIIFFDRIDEWLVSHMTEYKGKTLKSVTQGEMDDSSDNSESDIKKTQEEYKDLVDSFKSVLSGKVKDVRISSRLVNSPSCLVGESNDMGKQMQNILKAAGQHVPTTLPTLEINPKHEIIKRMHVNRDDNFSDWIHLVYGQAVLSESGSLENPSEFVSNINNIILSNNGS